MGIISTIKNNIKGKKGEKLVHKELNPWIFGRVNHREIDNLILVDDLGKSHQIDHVEIRETGIFVIETKNYKGTIYGRENDDKWTQFLSKRDKYQFVNPIKQNKSHIYHINKLLDGKYSINSVVVFVQNNSKKIKVDYVVDLRNLKRYLKSFKPEKCLTNDEMDEIYNVLMENNTKTSNFRHVKSIKKTQKELKAGVCPRCGGKLIERKSGNKSFIGCSNYPECRFTIKKLD